MSEKARNRHGLGMAVLDGTGDYRYRLTRIWDPARPVLSWCMLNPSTADASMSDPTLDRVVGFSKEWGFGGSHVVNLFALRSPSPAGLRRVDDPVGPLNDEYIFRAGDTAGLLVVAWGNGGVMTNPLTGTSRADEVLENLLEHDDLVTLGMTAMGQPRHPLYVPSDRTPEEWV